MNRLLIGALLVLFTIPANLFANEIKDSKYLFHIERNKNKNQVRYAVTVDENCLPRSSNPILGYWLELESGPDVTSKLSMLEQKFAYGIGEQTIKGKSEVHFRLKAKGIENLKFKAIIRLQDKQCTAEGYVIIDGKWAKVKRIYVFAKERTFGFPDVKYVDIEGLSADGSSVSQRISP